MTNKVTSPRVQARNIFSLLVLFMAVLLAISFASGFLWSPELSSQGLLKFSIFELSPIQDEGEVLSAEELEKLPFHMRPREGTDVGKKRVPLLVKVILDGRTLIEKDFKPGGLRMDGPIRGYQELTLSPGEHEVVINVRNSSTREEYLEFRDNFKIMAAEIKVIEVNYGKVIVR